MRLNGLRLNQIHCFSLCLLGLLVLMPKAQACEPAAIDWHIFQQSYDLNHDGEYSLEEFKRVQDFSPYPWPKDSHYQGRFQQDILFKLLDQDKNKRLSRDEIEHIYPLLDNPCERFNTR